MSPRGRPAVRGERAGRILDAAAELLQRYGYDRTTIDDVARAAGVAKGTLYAHWPSRELLFLALLRRERAALLVEVCDRMAGAAGPADLRLLLIELVRAYQHRPLLTAVLMRDAGVLGRLGRTAEAKATPHSGFVDHLVTLRAGGWIRTDSTLTEQVAVLSAVFLGFFLTAPLMPDEFRLPDETVPPLLADTICRALERPAPLTPAEVAAVDRATHSYVRAAVDAATQQLHDVRLSEEEDT